MSETLQSMAWRLLRGAVATALAQTLALQPDWSNPTIALKTLFTSFVTGLILAISVGIRDNFGDPKKSEGVINKLPL